MKHFFRIKFIVISLVCACIAVFLKKTYFPEKSYNSVLKDNTLRASYLNVYLQAAEEIKQVWEKGDLANSPERCEEFYWSKKETGEEFSQCNPNFLNCYYSNTKNNEILITVDGVKYTVYLKRDFDPILEFSRKKRFYARTKRSDEIMIRLGIKEILNSEQEIILKDYCHEVFLPREEYQHSQRGFKDEGHSSYRGELDKSFMWKNDKNIFIDQFPVTQRDVFEWKVLTGFPVQEKNIFSWSDPSTNLKLEEMRSFCHFYNKKLLTTKLYDAATFFKKDEVKTSLFPWGDRRKGYLLNPVPSFGIPGYDDDSIDYTLCSRSFTKECFNKFKKPRNFNMENVSWVGIYQIVGGPLEALENEEWPYFNIRASSFYFDRFSPWHLLSNRFHWDGKGHTREHFDFKSSLTGTEGDDIYSPERIKVSFRCYREIGD